MGLGAAMVFPAMLSLISNVTVEVQGSEKLAYAADGVGRVLVGD
jgi:hypothetical protein